MFNNKLHTLTAAVAVAVAASAVLCQTTDQSITFGAGGPPETTTSTEATTVSSTNAPNTTASVLDSTAQFKPSRPLWQCSYNATTVRMPRDATIAGYHSPFVVLDSSTGRYCAHYSWHDEVQVASRVMSVVRCSCPEPLEQFLPTLAAITAPIQLSEEHIHVMTTSYTFITPPIRQTSSRVVLTRSASDKSSCGPDCNTATMRLLRGGPSAGSDGQCCVTHSPAGDVRRTDTYIAEVTAGVLAAIALGSAVSSSMAGLPAPRAIGLCFIVIIGAIAALIESIYMRMISWPARIRYVASNVLTVRYTVSPPASDGATTYQKLSTDEEIAANSAEIATASANMCAHISLRNYADLFRTPDATLTELAASAVPPTMTRTQVGERSIYAFLPRPEDMTSTAAALTWNNGPPDAAGPDAARIGPPAATTVMLRSFVAAIKLTLSSIWSDACDENTPLWAVIVAVFISIRAWLIMPTLAAVALPISGIAPDITICLLCLLASVRNRRRPIGAMLAFIALAAGCDSQLVQVPCSNDPNSPVSLPSGTTHAFLESCDANGDFGLFNVSYRLTRKSRCDLEDNTVFERHSKAVLLIFRAAVTDGVADMCDGARFGLPPQELDSSPYRYTQAWGPGEWVQSVTDVPCSAMCNAQELVHDGVKYKVLSTIGRWIKPSSAKYQVEASACWAVAEADAAVEPDIVMLAVRSAKCKVAEFSAEFCSGGACYTSPASVVEAGDDGYGSDKSAKAYIRRAGQWYTETSGALGPSGATVDCRYVFGTRAAEKLATDEVTAREVRESGAINFDVSLISSTFYSVIPPDSSYAASGFGFVETGNSRATLSDFSYNLALGVPTLTAMTSTMVFSANFSSPPSVATSKVTQARSRMPATASYTFPFIIPYHTIAAGPTTNTVDPAWNRPDPRTMTGLYDTELRGVIATWTPATQSHANNLAGALFAFGSPPRKSFYSERANPFPDAGYDDYETLLNWGSSAESSYTGLYSVSNHPTVITEHRTWPLESSGRLFNRALVYHCGTATDVNNKMVFKNVQIGEMTYAARLEPLFQQQVLLQPLTYIVASTKGSRRAGQSSAAPLGWSSSYSAGPCHASARRVGNCYHISMYCVSPGQTCTAGPDNKPHPCPVSHIRCGNPAVMNNTVAPVFHHTSAGYGAVKTIPMKVITADGRPEGITNQRGVPSADPQFTIWVIVLIAFLALIAVCFAVAWAYGRLCKLCNSQLETADVDRIRPEFLPAAKRVNNEPAESTPSSDTESCHATRRSFPASSPSAPVASSGSLAGASAETVAPPAAAVGHPARLALPTVAAHDGRSEALTATASIDVEPRAETPVY